MRRSFLPFSPLVFWLFALAFGAARGAGGPAGFDRGLYDFNPGWKLFVGDPAGAAAPEFDDSAWQPITLPRAWNEDDAFAKDIREHSTGIAWYRKTFQLPPKVEGRKVTIHLRD